LHMPEPPYKAEALGEHISTHAGPHTGGETISGTRSAKLVTRHR
jgi:hypothetical protein